MSRRIGILTGGGDCPGLNAVIRACCLTACEYGYEFCGFKDGFEGLYNKDYLDLNCSNVDTILNIGGTILGTSNIGHFDERPIHQEVLDSCLETYTDLNLDCIVCIGGDGTMSLAHEISRRTGINIVGVPKTIDNDLRATDQTFGFDSAVSIVTESVDRLATTASSHHRVMVVEVMGRNAGWIALASAVAGGAHVCLLPEQPWTYEDLFMFLKKRHEIARTYTIVIVSEGVKMPDSGEQISSNHKLGGAGNIIASEIRSHLKLECRCVVLGHVQRGGTPTSYDRILATKYGVKAAELACTGQYGKMASLSGTEIVAVDITEEMADQKLVDMENDQLVHTAKMLGINFGVCEE